MINKSLSNERIMRKLLTVGFVLFFLYCCGSKQEKVEKIIENGVEVVLN